MPHGMLQSSRLAEQTSFLDTGPAPKGVPDALPFTEAKRRATAAFERNYLVDVMARAGSVSGAARLAGLDRTNFRRLLQRHGLR